MDVTWLQGDKQSKLQRMRQTHEEKRERLENAVASDQKIKRVLGREIDLQVCNGRVGNGGCDGDATVLGRVTVV